MQAQDDPSTKETVAQQPEPQQISTLYGKEDIEFLNRFAMSNFSSTVLMLSDRPPEETLVPVAVMNHVTMNDLISYIHVYDYEHMDYLRLLKTLHLNAPLDISTHVVMGREPVIEMEVYDDESIDVALICFKKVPVKFQDIIFQVWRKLKSNGSILLKGIKHTDTDAFLEIQATFKQRIQIPPPIVVQINLIQQTQDLTMIKKPCYSLAPPPSTAAS